MSKNFTVGGNLTKFWENNFAQFLRHVRCTVSGKNVAQRLDVVSDVVIHRGSLKTEFSHPMFTEVYIISRIQKYLNRCCCLKSQHMFDVGSGQKITAMDSKRATTKCTAAARVSALPNFFLKFLRHYRIVHYCGLMVWF